MGTQSQSHSNLGYKNGTHLCLIEVLVTPFLSFLIVLTPIYSYYCSCSRSFVLVLLLMPPQTRRSRAVAAAHTSRSRRVAPLESSTETNIPDQRSSQCQAAIVTGADNNLQGKSGTSFYQAYLTQ